MSPLFFTFTVPSLWETAWMLCRVPVGITVLKKHYPWSMNHNGLNLWGSTNNCPKCPTGSTLVGSAPLLHLSSISWNRTPAAGQVLNWPFPSKVPVIGKKGREFIYPQLVARDSLSMACLLFLDMLFLLALFVLYSIQPPNPWYFIELYSKYIV